MLSKYNDICNDISAIDKKLDYSTYFAPINLHQENNIFLNNYKKKVEYNPIYKYKEINFDYFGIEKKIDKHIADNLTKTSPLDRILLRALIERKNLLNIFKNRCDSEQLTHYSVKTFGVPGDELIYKAKEIFSKKNKSTISNDNEKKNSAYDFKNILIKELQYLNFNWKVKVVETLMPKVSVDPENRTIYLNKNIFFSDNDIKRLIVHELWTHVLRSENGRKQKLSIFYSGLAGSISTEEGLAVYSEFVNNLLDNNMISVYAGRVIASQLCLTESFYNIFSKLTQYLPVEQSIQITQRVKRGLSNTEEIGGFTKDYIYLNGFNKVRKFVENGKDIKPLFIGAVGIDDIDDIESLINSNLLTTDYIIPKYFC